MGLYRHRTEWPLGRQAEEVEAAKAGKVTPGREIEHINSVSFGQVYKFRNPTAKRFLVKSSKVDIFHLASYFTY